MKISHKNYSDLVYCFDIETDGLEPTLIHVISVTKITKGVTSKSWSITDYAEMRELVQQDAVFVAHNGIQYDKPAIEKILEVKMGGLLIDTLALSWYLEPLRMKHGLKQYGEEFGIAKPEVDDWENETLEVYINRCEEDVRIQTKLWKQQIRHLRLLYDAPEELFNCINYLSSKMNQQAVQQIGWKLDRDKAIVLQTELQEAKEEVTKGLASVMPMIEKFNHKTRPKKPYKKDGSLSAIGQKWADLCEEHNVDFDSDDVIVVHKCWEDPNPNSYTQIKAWLFDLGWEPQTFKYKPDPDNFKKKIKIPQLKNSNGDDVCDSIKRLQKKVPELSHLSDMGIINHRLPMVTSLLGAMDETGKIQAECSGFTNTLRLKHKTLVNIPSTRKPYGERIRELLTVRSDKNILCGCDLSALEDKIKQHYIFDLDPDYVATLQEPGYDPHCHMAVVAGKMTEAEVKAFKDESLPKEEMDRLSMARYNAKQTNYSSQYGIQAPSLARDLGSSEDEAQSLLDAYWELNWAVKAVSEATIIKESRSIKWQWNPIAKMYFWLKADKDRFSTLVQGTGSYLFDSWINNIIERRPLILGQFHDEFITECRIKDKEAVKKLILKALDDVNTTNHLNVDLGTDVQFGENYALIH